MSTPQRLKTDLVAAMRDRDRVRVSTLRTLISAIDNAGAVADQGFDYDPKIGFGHDQDRREVNHEEIRNIIIRERDDLVAASTEYRSLGVDDRAEEFERRAQIAASYVD